MADMCSHWHVCSDVLSELGVLWKDTITNSEETINVIFLIVYGLLDNQEFVKKFLSWFWYIEVIYHLNLFFFVLKQLLVDTVVPRLLWDVEQYFEVTRFCTVWLVCHENGFQDHRDLLPFFLNEILGIFDKAHQKIFQLVEVHPLQFSSFWAWENMGHGWKCEVGVLIIVKFLFVLFAVQDHTSLWLYLKAFVCPVEFAVEVVLES